MTAPLFLPAVPNPARPLNPMLRCNNCLAAGVSVSALGVEGGNIFPGVLSPLFLVVRSAADLNAADRAEDPEALEGVYALARSLMALLALLPNLRPSSSLRLFSGNLKDGREVSSGSSPPSNARGVEASVPQVKSDGNSCGEGDGSLGTKG